MPKPKHSFTLNGLSEEVIRLFNNFRPTAEVKLEKREVANQIRVIASEILRKEWFIMRQTGENKHLSQLYIGRFDDIPVERDDKTKENFIWLPVVEEDLPDGTGTQNIVPNTPNAEKNIPMIPIPPNAEVVISQLPVGAMEQRWAFQTKRDRVVFSKVNGSTLLEENIKTVNVTMVVALADTVDDLSAPIAIPAHVIPEILRQTLSIFGIERELEEEEDLVNDNT